MDSPSTSGHSWTSYVSVGGLASLGCAGLLWCLSKEEGARASKINSLTCHENLDELRHLQGLLPLLVAVRGRVNSSNPKKCELSDKLAVVHEIVEEEIWRKERENGRVVNEPFEIKRAADRVEWFLEDGVSATRVKVENVMQAERLSSVMHANQIFVPEDTSKGGLARFILDKTWHMAKQGVRKTERYLPVGSIVTVVGELDQSVLAREPPHTRVSRGGPAAAGEQASSSQTRISPPTSHPDSVPSAPPLPAFLLHPGHHQQQQGQLGALSDGEPLLLRKPGDGGPFIITPLNLQQLQASMSNASRVYKFAALGLGALGVALVARKLLQRLMKRWREAQAKRRMAWAIEQRRQRLATASETTGESTGDGSAGTGTSGGQEQGDDRATGTCVVCIDRQSDMVFVSCGHMCCCEQCGAQLNRCPVCRLRGQAIKVYRP